MGRDSRALSEAANHFAQLELNLTEIAGLIFFAAMIVNLIFWVAGKNKRLGLTSWLLSAIGTLTMTSVMVFRYLNVGHAPWVSLYETFLVMTWCFTTISIFADRITKSLIPTTATNIFATICLLYIATWPASTKEGFNLVPALQSPWLVIHVFMMFLSYGGMAVSGGAALVHLFTKNPKTDELSYKMVMFAFPILSLGVTLGAVWAYASWGRYWGWDPKETAALVTWFIYAAYIHLRMVMGWSGIKASILNLVGFGAVIFTWLGLNLVGQALGLESLHLYTER
ncbi:MAG TPA: cytochrome c biogenesis protein CcsA [bacterium]|jgi:ABC-type transport system involved in cytochrome c biogenesis permease subunit